jgi:hypothetical protein
MINGSLLVTSYRIVGAILFSFIFGTLLGLLCRWRKHSFGYLIVGFIGCHPDPG